jgi:hypothetical protein
LCKIFLILRARGVFSCETTPPNRPLAGRDRATRGTPLEVDIGVMANLEGLATGISAAAALGPKEDYCEIGA